MEEIKNSDKKALKAKKRRRIQMIRKIKVGTGLCVGLALVLYLLSAFVFFKISTIDVSGIKDEDGNVIEGSIFYSDEDIIKISGVETGDSLVLVSKRKTEEAIEKLLPYIGNAQVRRKYPSTLRIIVEDTSAAYALDAADGYILLNEEFKVLETSDKVPSGCAKVIGIPVENSESGMTVKFTDEGYKSRIETIKSAFYDAEMSGITKIDISNIANIKVTVDGRFTLVLGTLTQMREKLIMGKKTIEKETEDNPYAKIIIDLTDPDRAYVRNDYSPDETEEESSEISEGEETTTQAETPENVPEETPEEIPEEIPEAVG